MFKFVFAFLMASTLLLAQPDSNQSNIAKSDSTDNYKEWDLNFWGMDSFKDLKRPTIELEYGFNQSYYNTVLSKEFNPNNRFMGKIGYANYGETVEGSGLLKYDFSSLFYAQSLGDVDKLSDDGKLNTNVMSFGVMSSNGYGYTLGENFFIILTHGTGLSWNSLDFSDPDGVIDPSQIDLIKVMDNGIRFGELYEAGVKIRLIENIGLSANYSENMIMPRFQFWYWSLGKVIEGTTQGLAELFISRVKTTSPELVPIIYFVIKNGISYGFNRLREKNMNWPSETAPPLFEKNVNIGISIIL